MLCPQLASAKYIDTWIKFIIIIIITHKSPGYFNGKDRLKLKKKKQTITTLWENIFDFAVKPLAYVGFVVPLEFEKFNCIHFTVIYKSTVTRVRTLRENRAIRTENRILNNGRVTNREPEVAFNPFRALTLRCFS